MERLYGSFDREARKLLQRLVPRLEYVLAEEISKDPLGWVQFKTRLHRNFPVLFNLYYEVYGGRYDFCFQLEDLLIGSAQSWFSRPLDLRQLDEVREKNPLWFQSNQMLGGVCYVDLFANTLDGIKSKIPYFKELGLTYLHLMPLFKTPEGENDGGYAVSSYRELHPPLGTIDDLASLALELRQAGISLVVDLVFNHTSDEHIWAKCAKTGDEDHLDYYRVFPNRELPDAYERNLREIFPDEHTGAFTYFPDLFKTGGWVWTTFHSYQWDLNYANPEVFNRMAQEMLFLANQGVEVIRLDAVAFIWKKMGTACENLSEAHTLIRAFNAVARISAPALLFKSEAIVHPDEVAKYIDPTECQLSYNPLLMALLWNSLATRKVRLLSQALSRRFKIHPETAWVNYVRVHDDIGWTFSDEDAATLGIKGGDHRHFLNEFYRGRFDGSFARGLPFQENPKTGDCRISGTCASLAGLEKALDQEASTETELAIRRILLIYGIIMTVGGIPLIYLGDEIATLNDYSYQDDPAHMRDSRWVHRPRTDWAKYERRNDPDTIEGRVFQEFQKLIRLRKEHITFSVGEFEIVATGNDHVLGYQRSYQGHDAVSFANFSEQPQLISWHLVNDGAADCLQKIHGSSQLVSQTSMTVDPLDFLVLEITN